MNAHRPPHDGHHSDDDGVVDPMAVLELLEEEGAPAAVQLAGYLEPDRWLAALGPCADPADAVTWAQWVADVTRIIRGAYIVERRRGHRPPAMARLGDLTDVDVLIAVAETYGREDIAEWMRVTRADLLAVDTDGRALRENPTGVTAAVIPLPPRRTP